MNRKEYYAIIWHLEPLNTKLDIAYHLTRVDYVSITDSIYSYDELLKLLNTGENYPIQSFSNSDDTKISYLSRLTYSSDVLIINKNQFAIDFAVRPIK